MKPADAIAVFKGHRLYVVELIHRVHDWNATLSYRAPNAKTARKWAPNKMAQPSFWLVTSATLAKVEGGAT